MIRLFTTTILTLGFVFTGVSQDAEGLLLKLSEKAKTYKTIDATYSSKMVDLKNDFEEEMKGHILIEDSKFKLDLGDFLIISNGLSVWTYEKETNDCYLDDAEMLIEEGMDPSKIFAIWKMISNRNGWAKRACRARTVSTSIYTPTSWMTNRITRCNFS